MTAFGNREAALEGGFVHDQDLLFRAQAHRTKAVAQWAGRLMKKAGPDLAAYRERMLGVSRSGGDEALIRCLHDDLDAAGQIVSIAMLRDKMNALLADAVSSSNVA